LWKEGVGAAAGDAGMGNMPGMTGMQGMGVRSDSLMPMMRVHLDSLAAISPQVAAGMLSMHEAMASRMLDAMGRT